MDYTIENIGPVKRKITIQVQPQELSELEQKVLRRLQKNTEVPGFRRGRVPLSIIRSRYQDTIRMELMEEAISRFYGQVLDEGKIQPISRGKVTDIQFDTVEKGMEFSIEVEVEPEVELKKYKGLRVEKDIVEVTDELIEKTIQQIREEHAIVKEMDESKEGHEIVVDIQQLGEGDLPIVGRKYENVRIVLGKGEFDPELEKQLIGAKLQEKRIVRREVPPAPDSKEGKPKIESYEVTIKAIQEKELPPLTDDFVRELGEEGLETVEQLRERVRENLKRHLEEQSRRVFVNRMVDELLKENPFELPEAMVEHYLDHLVEDFKRRYKGQKLDEKAIRESYRVEAVHDIRWHLLKNKIIEVENLSVSDEEIDQLIDGFQLEESEKKRAKADRQYREELRRQLLDQKVIELLEKHAEIVEVKSQEPDSQV